LIISITKINVEPNSFLHCEKLKKGKFLENKSLQSICILGDSPDTLVLDLSTSAIIAATPAAVAVAGHCLCLYLSNSVAHGQSGCLLGLWNGSSQFESPHCHETIELASLGKMPYTSPTCTKGIKVRYLVL
jgi:hypothetical protein